MRPLPLGRWLGRLRRWLRRGKGRGFVAHARNWSSASCVGRVATRMRRQGSGLNGTAAGSLIAQASIGPSAWPKSGRPDQRAEANCRLAGEEQCRAQRSGMQSRLRRCRERPDGDRPVHFAPLGPPCAEHVRQLVALAFPAQQQQGRPTWHDPFNQPREVPRIAAGAMHFGETGGARCGSGCVADGQDRAVPRPFRERRDGVAARQQHGVRAEGKVSWHALDLQHRGDDRRQPQRRDAPGGLAGLRFRPCDQNRARQKCPAASRRAGWHRARYRCGRRPPPLRAGCA